MKKIYRSVYSFTAWLCAAGMSLLGYSCGEPALMYGTLTGDYEIKGTVTTEVDKPVDGATIRVTGVNIPSGEYSYSTTTSNAEGAYEIKDEGCHDNLKVVCIPDDPTLEPDSTVVKMTYEKSGKKKNDGWYQGLAKKVVDFKLKKKTSN